MDTLLKEHISHELDKLSPLALREVLSFIESISRQTNVDNEKDPILSVAGILSGNGVSVEEIEAELYGQGNCE